MFTKRKIGLLIALLTLFLSLDKILALSCHWSCMTCGDSESEGFKICKECGHGASIDSDHPHQCACNNRFKLSSSLNNLVVCKGETYLEIGYRKNEYGIPGTDCSPLCNTCNEYSKCATCHAGAEISNNGICGCQTGKNIVLGLDPLKCIQQCPVNCKKCDEEEKCSECVDGAEVGEDGKCRCKTEEGFVENSKSPFSCVNPTQCKNPPNCCDALTGTLLEGLRKYTLGGYTFAGFDWQKEDKSDFYNLVVNFPAPTEQQEKYLEYHFEVYNRRNDIIRNEFTRDPETYNNQISLFMKFSFQEVLDMECPMEYYDNKKKARILCPVFFKVTSPCLKSFLFYEINGSVMLNLSLDADKKIIPLQVLPMFDYISTCLKNEECVLNEEIKTEVFICHTSKCTKKKTGNSKINEELFFQISIPNANGFYKVKLHEMIVSMSDSAGNYSAGSPTQVNIEDAVDEMFETEDGYIYRWNISVSTFLQSMEKLQLQLHFTFQLIDLKNERRLMQELFSVSIPESPVKLIVENPDAVEDGTGTGTDFTIQPVVPSENKEKYWQIAFGVVVFGFALSIGILVYTLCKKNKASDMNSYGKPHYQRKESHNTIGNPHDNVVEMEVEKKIQVKE